MHWIIWVDIRVLPRYILSMNTDNEIVGLLQRYFANKKNVQKVLLFGSYARNTQTKRSDIDVIIIMETEKRFFDRYDEFSDIYSVVKIPCDMLIYSTKEWHEMCSRKFIKNITKESKEIYVSGE
ncbi:MAG: nucleotidyltransferase domain-containing protein [Spirochaetota bacterium]